MIGTDRRAGSSDDRTSARTPSSSCTCRPGSGRRTWSPSRATCWWPSRPRNGFGGGQDKINAAYEHGGGGQAGTRLLSATLTRLTGIRFDGAALIDFSGFRKVIDLLGGVQMCVDTEVRSIHTNRVFHIGCQQMNGAQALDYVRQRYDLPGGDYDRQRHQQQLLQAMLDRAGEANLRSNPVKLDQVIRAVGGSLTVDTNGVPLEDLLLALRALPADALRGRPGALVPADHRRGVVRGAGQRGQRALRGRPRHPDAGLGTGQPALGHPVVTVPTAGSTPIRPTRI